MHERIMAVGCGGLVLLLTLLTGAVSSLTVFQEGRPGIIGWALTGGGGLFAIAAFAVAIRRKDDDEDLFEGDRGLAVALTIIVVLAVTGVTVAAFLQPDFWRGMWDGASH